MMVVILKILISKHMFESHCIWIDVTNNKNSLNGNKIPILLFRSPVKQIVGGYYNYG